VEQLALSLAECTRTMPEEMTEACIVVPVVELMCH
jgi:hypothetical protein